MLRIPFHWHCYIFNSNGSLYTVIPFCFIWQFPFLVLQIPFLCTYSISLQLPLCTSSGPSVITAVMISPCPPKNDAALWYLILIMNNEHKKCPEYTSHEYCNLNIAPRVPPPFSCSGNIMTRILWRRVNKCYYIFAQSWHNQSAWAIYNLTILELRK